MDAFEKARLDLRKLDWHNHNNDKGFFELYYNKVLKYLAKTVSDFNDFRKLEQQVSGKLEETVKKLHPIKKRQLLNEVNEMLGLHD